MQTKSALVIAHEADGPGGQISVRLAERGYEVHTHVVAPDLERPNDATPFPQFDDYDVIVLMGSIRSLTNKAEIDSWVHDELAAIRKAFESGQPMLGVCFGGQLISDALGGSVELSPETEIGWFEIENAPGEDNPVGGGPWMEWHHDRFDPPPGATVLAQTPTAPQLFTIGRVVGTQFHPEVDYAHVDAWLEGAHDDYLADYGQDRDAILDAMQVHDERNTKQCHALVDWFLDDVAQREIAP